MNHFATIMNIAIPFIIVATGIVLHFFYKMEGVEHLSREEIKDKHKMLHRERALELNRQFSEIERKKTIRRKQNYEQSKKL